MNLTHSYYAYIRRFKRFPSNDVELGEKRTNEAVPTIEIQNLKFLSLSRLMRDNWLKLLKSLKISQLFRIMHTSRLLPAVKLSGVTGDTNRSVDFVKYFVSCSLAPYQELLSSTRHQTAYIPLHSLISLSFWSNRIKGIKTQIIYILLFIYTSIFLLIVG